MVTDDPADLGPHNCTHAEVAAAKAAGPPMALNGKASNATVHAIFFLSLPSGVDE